VEARFVERPNRFLLRCRIDGETVQVHMADPGRLRELLLPGARLRVRHTSAPHRKTEWTAVLVERPGGGEWISLDTTLPNALIHRALAAGALQEFRGWRLEAREWAHGRSRLDFLLKRADASVTRPDRAPSDPAPSGLAPSDPAPCTPPLPSPKLALEVKSVTLVEHGVARFPDAVTARGARHVRALMELAREPGWEAAILFVLQRADAHRIEAARSIDPTFAEALAEARDAGVRILGRRCRVTPEAVTLGEIVPAGLGR
jgi:sugar fermentation stimulation protein A